MVRGNILAQTKTTTYSKDLYASIHNRFDIEVIDSRTGEVRQRAQAENCICKGMWQYLFVTRPTSSSGTTYTKFLAYGRGSGTPSEDDTSMFTHSGYLVRSSRDGSGWDSSNGVEWYRYKYVMLETVAVGVPISEVGLVQRTSNPDTVDTLPSSSTALLCTHAMLKDMNGNPVTIEKTDTDIINFYATVYLHINIDESSGIGRRFGILNGQQGYGVSMFDVMLGLDSNLYGYSLYMALGDSSDNINGSTSSTGLYQKVYNVSSSGSLTDKTVTLTASRVPAADANNTVGYRDIVLGRYVNPSSSPNYSCIIMWIDVGGTAYPGTNIVNESIGTGDGETKDFATAFPVEGNCTVLVNGEQAQCSIERGVHRVWNTHNMVHYIRTCRLNLSNRVIRRPIGYQNGYNHDSCHVSSTYLEVNGAAHTSADTIRLFGEIFFENPLYETTPITHFYLSSAANRFDLLVSNDGYSWTSAGTMSQSATGDGYAAVPEQYQSYRYFKVSNPSGFSSDGTFRLQPYSDKMSSDYKVLHFANPPAAGSVITASYFTKSIAKDSNHVFDFSMTFHFSEYTE